MSGEEKIWDIEGFILAGGLSVRMGRDKPFLLLEGKTLLERAFETLSEIFKKVTVITRPGARLPVNIPAIEDIIPGKGPLGGIYTALKTAAGEYVFVCAADLPFLDKEIIRNIAQKASPGIKIVTVSIKGSSNCEPLHTIYSKSLLPDIERMLNNGELAVSPLLAGREGILRVETDNEKALFNINTPADFQKCLKEEGK